MRAYSIMLFLLIFGWVAGGINASGLYDAQAPTSEIGIEEADVIEITEGMSSQDVNPLTMYSIIITMGNVLCSGFLALLTILPFLLSWGCPFWAAMMIQGPIWLVEVVGIYQAYTGYNWEGMS